MKAYTITTIALSMLLSAGSAVAASQINSGQLMDKQHLGSVQVQVRNGTLDDAVEALSQKAKMMGADHFRITSADTPGMGSSARVTAEIYK